MLLKSCLYCGKEFSAVKKTTKYCCKSCADKSMMHRHYITCPNCGKSIYVRYTQKYCSYACAIAYRNLQYQNSKVYNTCPVCKQSFTSRHAGQKFCSRECANIGRIKPTSHNISDAQREYYRNSMLRMWENPEFRVSVSERMRNNNPSTNPDIVAKIKHTKIMQGKIPNNFNYGNGKISLYEQKVYDRLVNLGFEYNCAINTKPIRIRFPENRYPNAYKPDFVNEEHKLCIEIDGYGHSSKKDKQRDYKKEHCLQMLGYTTLRFTHKDIDDGKFDEWLNSFQKNI